MAQKSQSIGYNSTLQLGLVLSLAYGIWLIADFRSTSVNSFSDIKAQLGNLQQSVTRQDNSIAALKERVDKLESIGSELARRNAEDLAKVKDIVNMHVLTSPINGNGKAKP